LIPFWVREYRDHVDALQAVKDGFQGKVDFMWEFQQYVPAMICQREGVATAQAIDQLGLNTNIRTRHYSQWNISLLYPSLKLCGFFSNHLTAIIFKHSQLMGRHNDGPDAANRGHTSHFK